MRVMVQVLSLSKKVIMEMRKATTMIIKLKKTSRLENLNKTSRSSIRLRIRLRLRLSMRLRIRIRMHWLKDQIAIAIMTTKMTGTGLQAATRMASWISSRM